jgi:hypothetical protein
VRDICRWGYNVRADIKEVDSNDVAWNQMVSDGNKWWALVDTTLKTGIPKNLRNTFE